MEKQVIPNILSDKATDEIKSNDTVFSDMLDGNLTSFDSGVKFNDPMVNVDKEFKESNNVTMSADAARKAGKIVLTRTELELALNSGANEFIIEKPKVIENPYPPIYGEYVDGSFSNLTKIANKHKKIVHRVVKQTIEEHGIPYLTPKRGFAPVTAHEVVSSFIKKFELLEITSNGVSTFVLPNGSVAMYELDGNKHNITKASITHDAFDYFSKTDYSELYIIDASYVSEESGNFIPVGSVSKTYKRYESLAGNEYGDFKPKYLTKLNELGEVPFIVSVPKFVVYGDYEENGLDSPVTVINHRVIPDNGLPVVVQLPLKDILKHTDDGVRVTILDQTEIMPLLADLEHSLKDLEENGALREMYPEMFELEEIAREFIEDTIEQYILPYLTAIGKNDEIEKVKEQIAPTLENPFLKNMQKQFDDLDLFSDTNQVSPDGNNISVNGTNRLPNMNIKVGNDSINLDYSSDEYMDYKQNGYKEAAGVNVKDGDGYLFDTVVTKGKNNIQQILPIFG